MDLLVKTNLYSTDGNSIQDQVNYHLQSLKIMDFEIIDVDLTPTVYSDLLRYTLVIKYK
jgi:hypothetical protein